jgi:hypothetical protein
LLTNLGLTGVNAVGNWLTCRVTPLKKQIHPGWEYSGLGDLSCEASQKAGLLRLLGELFTSTDSYPLPNGVQDFHIRVKRDEVRSFLH